MFYKFTGSRGNSANGVKTECFVDTNNMSASSKKTGSAKLSNKPKDAKDSTKSQVSTTSSIPVIKDTDTINSSKSRKTSDKVDQSDKSTVKSFGSKISKQENQSVISGGSKGTKSGSEKGTSKSRSERTASPYLEPPLIDKKPDQMILGSEEAMVDLRKHDREALKGYNAKVLLFPPNDICHAFNVFKLLVG